MYPMVKMKFIIHYSGFTQVKARKAASVCLLRREGEGEGGGNNVMRKRIKERRNYICHNNSFSWTLILSYEISIATLLENVPENGLFCPLKVICENILMILLCVLAVLSNNILIAMLRENSYIHAGPLRQKRRPDQYQRLSQKSCWTSGPTTSKSCRP